MITEKRKNIIILFFSIIFSYLNVKVYALKINTDIKEYVIVLNILIVAAITFLVIKIITNNCTDNKLSIKETEKNEVRKYFIFVFVLQLVCWIPVWLAYWPTLFNYDVGVQLLQYKSGVLNTHHPLIHSFFILFFYWIGERLGNYNLGMSLEAITQMILFSALLGSSHLYLFKCNISKKIRTALLVITCFSPYFSLMAISTTKDTLYAGFCCLFVSVLCWILIKPNTNKKTYLIYVMAIVGCVLFRNNGIFGIATMFVVLFFYNLKSKNTKLFKYTLIGIVVACLIEGSLLFITKAQDATSNEALSIPYLQIARVYYNEDLDEETKERILIYIPSISKYTEILSDGIKGDGKAGTNKKDFAMLYLELGLKYPKTYVDAFLALNGSYLSILDDSYSWVYGKGGRESVFETLVLEDFNITCESKLPWLKNFYDNLYTRNDYKDIALYKWFLSPALYVWMILIGGFYSLLTKKNNLLPFVYILTQLLTTLMGPCVLARYTLPLMVCVPQLLLMSFTRREIKND